MTDNNQKSNDRPPPRRRGRRDHARRHNRSPKSSKSRVKAAQELGVSQAEAQVVQREVGDAPFVVFDIETTGGNPERNGITEIFAIKYQNGKASDTFYSMVNPKVPIPPIVRRMTGITNQMVKDAPFIEEVMPDFVEFTGDALLVSHNTIGDLKFLRYFSNETCGKQMSNFFLCTHLLVDKLFPEAPDKSLNGLGKYFELNMGDLHRAEADARLTLALFQVLCNALKKRKIKSVREAILFQGDYESSIRLGWGVTRKLINSLPEMPGVFWLQDASGKTIFASSAPNLQRDVRKLQNWSQVPKPVLRQVFKAVDIKYQTLSSNLESLMRECELLEKSSILPDPIQWHQRRLQTLNIVKEKQKFRVNISAVPAGAIAVFGPIRDRKRFQEYMNRLAEAFGKESTRQGFYLAKDQLDELMNHVSGESELKPPERLLPLHQLDAWLQILKGDQRKIGFGISRGRVVLARGKRIDAAAAPRVRPSLMLGIKLLMQSFHLAHKDAIPPLSPFEAQRLGAALWWACVSSNRREGEVIALGKRFAVLTKKSN